MFGHWFLWVCIALFVSPSVARADSLHPQDGPHVDLRFVVSDQDVRLTIGMNLPFLDESVRTQRELQSEVDPSEEAAVLEAVRRIVDVDTPILINGQRVEPQFEQLSIERLSEDSLYLFPSAGRKALTRFSVVAVYACSEPAESISIRWSHFPASALSAAFEDVGDEPPPMVIDAQFRAEGRVRIMRFSETDPTQTWRAGGDTPETAVESLPAVEVARGTPIPVLSLAVVAFGVAIGLLVVISKKRGLGIALIGIGVGAGIGVRDLGVRWFGEPSVPEEQAVRLFAILHSNIYRAFDFTDEDDIYDTLAISASGELLDSLYKQIRLGLVQAENGGGVGRVTSLELKAADILGLVRTPEGIAFEVYAEWDVEGTVYHFGHSHAKQSPYAGLFRVAQTNDGWRIDQAEPRQSEGMFSTPGEL